MSTRGNRRPITQADFDAVARLHAEGKSRNQIVRELRRSCHTVSRIAAELGLSFDRGNDPNLRKATEARKADARAKRAALANALLDDAERLRQQLFAPTITFNIGGKDNTYTEHPIPEPTFRDKRDIMHAVGIAVDRAVRLDEYDSGAGLGQVVSLLETIGQGLVAKHGTGDEPDQP